jgi:hypothetical protein
MVLDPHLDKLVEKPIVPYTISKAFLFYEGDVGFLSCFSDMLNGFLKNHY